MRILADYLTDYTLAELKALSRDLAQKAKNGPTHRAHETAYESIAEGLENDPKLARKYGAAAALLLLEENDATVLTIAFPLVAGYSAAGSAACFERLMKGQHAFDGLTSSRANFESMFLNHALHFANEDEINTLIQQFEAEKWDFMLFGLLIQKRDARMVDVFERLVAQNYPFESARLGLFYTFLVLHQKEHAIRVAKTVSRFEERERLAFLEPCQKHLDPAIFSQIRQIFYGTEIAILENSLNHFREKKELLQENAANTSSYPFHIFGVTVSDTKHLEKILSQFAKLLNKENFESGLALLQKTAYGQAFLRQEILAVTAREIATNSDCEVLCLLGAISNMWPNQDVSTANWNRLMKGPEWPTCYNEADNFQLKTALSALRIQDPIKQEYLTEMLKKKRQYTPIFMHYLEREDARLPELFEEAMLTYSVGYSYVADLARYFAKKDRSVILRLCESASRFSYKSQKKDFVLGLTELRPELRAEVEKIVKPEN